MKGNRQKSMRQPQPHLQEQNCAYCNLNEISRYLSLVMGVNMRRLTLSADEGLFEGYIDLYVNSKEVLEKMIKKLSGIEGIESVTRSEL